MSHVLDVNGAARAGDERPFYFRHGGQRLFATLHAPSPGAPARGGWLLCAPFAEERGFAQRTTVEWARTLAAAGHWAMRFDYRGYGDSEGWFEDFGAEDHVEDILAARAELERRSGARCRGLWGLRLGASLAVLAAERGAPDVALALWDPIVSGDRYMDHFLRKLLAKEMANTGRAPRDRVQLKAHMAAGGTVDVEGHPLTDRTYRSIARVDLLARGAPHHGEALIAQISARAEAGPRRDLEALRAALGKAELELVRTPPPWQENDEYASTVRPEALFGTTLRWILGRAQAAEAPGPTPPWRAEDGELTLPSGAVERPVAVPSPGGTLRGILHLPARVDRARPAVALQTPGFNCRTARYRLYVKLARELADRGFVVLRLDPHGIGDADGALEHATIVELYNDIETGLFVEDTRTALAFLEREVGVGTALLVGLCGGAITSLLAAGVDPRTRGVVAAEVPLLLTPRIAPGPQAAAPTARAGADLFLRSYARKLLDVAAWKRFLSFRSDYRSLASSLRVSIAGRLRGRRQEPGGEEWLRARLGPRANVGLVASLRACAARGLPVLLPFGSTRNHTYFTEIAPILPGADGAPGAPIQATVVEEADHGFSVPAHARELVDGIVAWCVARGAGEARPGRTGS